MFVALSNDNVFVESRRKFINRSWGWNVLLLIFSFSLSKGNVFVSSQLCQSKSRFIVPTFSFSKLFLLWNTSWRVHFYFSVLQIEGLWDVVLSRSRNIIMGVSLLSPGRFVNKRPFKAFERNSKFANIVRILSNDKRRNIINVPSYRGRISSFVVARVTSFSKSECCGSKGISGWKDS